MKSQHERVAGCGTGSHPARGFCLGSSSVSELLFDFPSVCASEETDVQSIGMVAGAVTGIVAGALLIFLLIWLLIRRKSKERYEEEDRPNEIREDAEAPRARLVKPSSSSSGSRSSRSGSSSTRSTGNSASRSQRTLSSEAAPQPGLATQAYSLIGPEVRGSEPKKAHHTTLTKAETTLSTMPSQSRAFQTV